MRQDQEFRVCVARTRYFEFEWRPDTGKLRIIRLLPSSEGPRPGPYLTMGTRDLAGSPEAIGIVSEFLEHCRMEGDHNDGNG